MSEDAGRLVGGRYRLGDVLGQGGMGTVWRAEDEILGRTVAVKELRFPSSVDDDERQRLITRTLREAKAIARVRSGSAVTVFDVVDEDDRPWIVMELVEGGSLADRIKRDGPLTPQRAAEVGLAVLDVLRAAHREGILHRDVKPSNVLLEDGTGRVVLTDFGIAKVEGDPSVTSTGMLVGAPSYISPERARGKPPGPPADLWSLGGLLFAAVEGRPPYDKGSAISTLTAVMTEPVPEAPRAGGLNEAIHGLLRKDPEERLDVDAAQALLKPVAAGTAVAEATRAMPVPEAPEAGEKAPSGRQGKSGRKGAAGAAAGKPAAAKKGRATASAAGGTGSAPPEAGDKAAPDGPPEGASSGSGTGAKAGAVAAAAGKVFAGRRPQKRTAVVAAAVVAAVVALAGAVALSTGDDAGKGSGTAPGKSSASQKEEQGKGGSPGGENASDAPSGDGGTENEPDENEPDEKESEGAEELPEGYKEVVDKQFHFRMAMPEGFSETGIAGQNSGRRYAGEDGLPKIQVDFNNKPLDDAAAAWRGQEPAVRSTSNGYHRISLEETDWRDYPTVADWQFTRKSDGRTVRVLNRGFRVDDSHGYAIMITCADGAWDDKKCATLRETALRTFEPVD